MDNIKNKETKKNTKFNGLSLIDSEKEYQRLFIAVKMNEEKDTSKLRKLRRYIVALKTRSANSNN